MMRRAVNFIGNGNLKLLRSREWICLQRLREPIASQRHLRQIFRMSRSNLLSAQENQVENTYNIQRVIFKKRRRGLIDILIPLGLGCLCSMAYNYCVLEPLEQALDESELSELYEEDIQPVFIPFPLTTREIRQSPYRGSDPEWQEFIKFSKQQDLSQQVRRDLATIILNVLINHPVLSFHVGKKLKVRRYWLDVDFPSEPPPEYIQSGLEIGDDYIAWTSRTVDSITVRRLQRALWPSSMTLSTWSFAKVVVADFIDRIASMIGFKTESPPTLEEILARHRQIVKVNRIPPHNASPLDDQRYIAGEEVPYIPSVQEPNKSEKESQNNSEFGVEEIINELQRRFSGPLTAFKRTFAKSWTEPVSHPPRGCITVSGLVEIETLKAYLIFDVLAHWDPQTRSYDMGSLVVVVRRIQLKKQGPKVGH